MLQRGAPLFRDESRKGRRNLLIHKIWRMLVVFFGPLYYICETNHSLLLHHAMKGVHLGEFEELVLLVACILYDAAYGVVIKETIEEQTGRPVRISAVHSALRRLEKKGYLSSRVGGATSERGGRRKRFFAITPDGKAVLLERRLMRERLWNQIPEFSLQSGLA